MVVCFYGGSGGGGFYLGLFCFFQCVLFFPGASYLLGYNVNCLHIKQNEPESTGGREWVGQKTKKKRNRDKK